MNYQKMRIDFTQKRGLTAPFVYKTGEIDVDGIEAELVNIDVEGSPIGFIKLVSPTGIERESALRIENGFAYFDIPKNEEGLYTVELTILNKKNKTRSGNVAIEVINSLSYDSEEYETLLDTITKHDAEYTANENIRIENENIRIENENIRIENENTRIIEHGDRMSKSDVATANAIQATQQANTATANAETATQATIQATTEAGSATTNAIQATNNAQAATVEADSATAKANVAATNAANATTTANQATVNANKATADANSATQSVNNAIAAGTVDLEPKQARTDTSGFEHANLKARLDSDYKRLSEEFYGVEFLGSNSTGKRLGRAYGLIANVGLDSAVNINDFDNQFPWSDIQTVNLNHDGVVTAIEGFPNFTRDGSNGEVMVRIPKFYQKREQNEDGSIRRYFISKHKLSGYFLNPAFIDSDSGKELDYAFIGAYEASSDGTKLFSRSGLYPQVSLNRAGFRTRATATGAGFHLEDVLLRNLIETLFYIEFATTNSQSIMNGQVNFSAQKTTVATTNTNYVIVSNTSANQYTIGQTLWLNNSNRKLLSKEVHDASNTRLVFEGTALTFAVDSTIDMRGWQCGSADSVIQRSGSIVSNTAGKSPFAYRGIENPWGNIWEFVDGICVKDWQTYICTDYKLYADQKYTLPYRPIGQLNGNANGYVSKMIFDEIFPFVQVPSSVSGGGSTTYFADYYYRDSGERTAFVGGSWDNGANAGLSAWHLSHSLASSHTVIGGRLAYKPKGV